MNFPSAPTSGNTALGVLVALTAACILSLSLLPRIASAAAISFTSVTATSSPVYTNTGFATTTKARTGDAVNFQLTISANPSATTTPIINIQGMGSTTMTNGGTGKYYYSTTTSSAWNEGAVQFYMAYGGTAGEATTTKSQADITAPNVIIDNTSPTLNSAAWTDTDTSTQFSGTDTFLLTFSETMATSTVTTSNVDTVLGLTNSHTFGTTGNGLALAWNTAGTELTITLGTDTTATGADTVDPTTAVKDGIGNPDATAAPVTLPDSASPSAPVGLTGTVFHGSVSASMSSSGSSKIMYKTDGTMPTCSTGTLYGGAFTISDSEIINAIGCDEANNASAVATAVYSPATGGGGGGGSAYSTPAVPAIPATPATATTTAVPATPATPANASGLSDSQIQSVLDVLASFDADAATIASVKASLQGTTNGSPVSAAVHVFKTALSTGSLGNEVKMLQQFLNSHGYPVATSGIGSLGNETTRFGARTRAALIKYQKAKGIVPASGYFGAKTQAAVNADE